MSYEIINLILIKNFSSNLAAAAKKRTGRRPTRKSDSESEPDSDEEFARSTPVKSKSTPRKGTRTASKSKDDKMFTSTPGKSEKTTKTPGKAAKTAKTPGKTAKTPGKTTKTPSKSAKTPTAPTRSSSRIERRDSGSSSERRSSERQSKKIFE